MSRYTNLWDAYRAERKKHAEYKEACAAFGGELFGGFERYIECPKERASYLPPDEDPMHERPSPRNVMRLLDDGRVGVVLVLQLVPDADEADPNPKEAVVSTRVYMPFRWRQMDDGTFRVQFGEDGDEWSVAREDPKSFEAFYDSIIAAVIEDFRISYSRPDGPRRIGFRTSS